MEKVDPDAIKAATTAKVRSVAPGVRSALPIPASLTKKKAEKAGSLSELGANGSELRVFMGPR